MTCTFCGSDEGVSHYKIKTRGFLPVVMKYCVTCAEKQRQRKNVLEVERLTKEAS